ncbi:hypothetical protein C8R43DRAFT_957686 [Mycena crocata]|nr:hypothetical protein C8R43DRAFT_957686 [Mycena crocata]
MSRMAFFAEWAASRVRGTKLREYLHEVPCRLNSIDAKRDQTSLASTHKHTPYNISPRPPKTDPDFEPGEFYIVKLPSSLLTRIQTMSDTSKEYMGAAVQKSAQEFVAAGDILRAWAANTTSTAAQSARLEAACNKYAKGGDAYAKAGAIFEVGERAAFCRDASGNAYMESFKAKRDAKDCEKMDLD